MSYDWGYRQGKKDSASCGMAKGGKVAVKAHSRAPRVSLPPPPPMAQPMPPAPVMPPSAVMPQGAPPDMGMKRGGKVRGYATGGKVTAKEPPKAAPPSKDMPENRKAPVKMAKGGKVNWIADATKNKGGLHRSLGIPAGEKIPAKKMAAAAKKSGTVGKQARLAETLKSLKK